MLDILNAFANVFLWPVNPANLDFENNPIMICLTCILLGIGISRIFYDLWKGFL